MEASEQDERMTETPEQLRARLLRCPRVKASVLKVARSQGVPSHEREDVLQETLFRTSQSTLPPGEEPARRYINGIAKFAAIDHMRKKSEEPAESLEELDGKAHPVRERLEQRAFMQSLFAQGYERFGKKFDWFLRSKVERETSQEIGAAAGVTPSHVRDEVSVVNRWFDAAWGTKSGGIGGILALLLAVGAGWWMTHRDRPVDESQLGTYAEVRTEHRVPMDAAALRQRGKKACEDGAWSACEHDLAAARLKDPQGTTQELLDWETTAQQRMVRVDAEEEQEMNAKPGQ
jgi:DNA-directed RNA polymerase specialized sigma24 family protein